jgi:hypothetical protein
MPDLDPRTRLAVLYNRFGDDVHDLLRRRYRGVDPDAITDAVMSAVLKTPADADPDAADFLYRLADRARDKLRSALRGDRRRRTREEKYARAVTTRLAAAPCPVDVLADAEAAAAIRDRIARTDTERRVWDLKQSGVTDPAELAARLGGSKSAARTVLARFRKRIERERSRTEDSP